MVPGDTLSVVALQTGEDTINETQIKQDGSNQSVILEQRGSGRTDNFAIITQDGANNVVDVLQNGTGNTMIPPSPSTAQAR